MYKRFKPNFTNITNPDEKIKSIHLCKREPFFGYDDNYSFWININETAGIQLLKEIIDSRNDNNINDYIVLSLKDNSIVVRKLFQNVDDKNIINMLRKCLIVNSHLFGNLNFCK